MRAIAHALALAGAILLIGLSLCRELDVSLPWRLAHHAGLVEAIIVTLALVALVMVMLVTIGVVP